MSQPVTKKQKTESKVDDIPKLANYIDGKFESPTTEQYLNNYEPATGRVSHLIPRSSSIDVGNAVAAAKRAFQTWRFTKAKARSEMLFKIADAIEARKDELAQVESKDCGKPLQLAKDVDVSRAVANFRFFAGRILHTHTECHEMEGEAINLTQRLPVGVCALITPWNLPLYLLSWKVAPALACGNTVVCKPSEITPMTAHYLAEIMQDCGLPPGVFNIIHGYGAVPGSALCSHKDVRLVSFTGGTTTGARVGQAAMQTFKKTSLELGGKNSTIVFADADFDKAVQGACRAAFANQGQVCLCGSRILVQAPIYDKFVAAFVVEAKKLVPGDPATSNFGSLTSEVHRDKVESYIELARKDGGTILLGGKRPDLPPPHDKGYFLEPTIITDLGHDHRCSQEEIFGPVVTVHKFETDEEALTSANSVQYGLAGSVWTNSLKRAHTFTGLWETGMVWVNTWLLRDLRVPFGGVKDSGLGREGGDYSFDFYSEIKNVCIKL